MSRPPCIQLPTPQPFDPNNPRVFSAPDALCSYDAAFHVANVSHVDRSSFLQLYPKFLELTSVYNFEFHWNESRIMDRGRCSCLQRWFQVKDVGLNSVYAAGWGVLTRLAAAVNDTTTMQLCAKEAAVSAGAIVANMFDASAGGFRSLYVDCDGQEKMSGANVVQNLLPLLLPSLPPHIVGSLIAEVPRLPFCCAHLLTCAFADSEQPQVQQHIPSAHRRHGRSSRAAPPPPPRFHPPCSYFPCNKQHAHRRFSVLRHFRR